MKDNPFYRNHIFRKADIERAKIRWYEYPALWFKSTYTQISDGYAFHHKFGSDGAIYIVGFEKIETIHPEDPPLNDKSD